MDVATLPEGLLALLAAAAVKAGATETIVSAMGAHADDANVAHYGCWALANIAASAEVGRPGGGEMGAASGAGATGRPPLSEHVGAGSKAGGSWAPTDANPACAAMSSGN